MVYSYRMKRNKRVLLARQLRKNMTAAERQLWNWLRGKPGFAGHRWHRQSPMLGWFADFYCPGFGIVVEVDGPMHRSDGARRYDLHRDRAMRRVGLLVLRFSNDEVLYDGLDVLKRIAEATRRRQPIQRSQAPWRSSEMASRFLSNWIAKKAKES